MADPLTLENIYSHSTIQTGTSGSLTGIQVGSNTDAFMVVAFSSSGTGFSILSSLTLSPAGRNEEFALTRKTQSTGSEIWWMKLPPHSPGILTHTLNFTLAGSYNWAAAAYVFYHANQAGNLSFESFWLDAKSTGDPVSPASLSVTDGSYMIDAVRIEQNIIAADGSQVDEFNLTTGAGATLVSYGSSYEEILTTTSSYLPGWTRQGSPTDDSWAYCGAVLKTTTNEYARITCS